MSDESRLAPGAKITCENGHYICTVVHELIANASRPIVKSEWFINYAPEHYQPGPGDGSDKCICGICGAHWIDERPGFRPDGTLVRKIAKIHTEGGWFPPNTPVNWK